MSSRAIGLHEGSPITTTPTIGYSSNGDGPVAADLRLFFDTLYSDGTGYIHVVWASDPYWDGEKVRYGKWSEKLGERHAYKYPTDVDAAAQKILQFDAGGKDAYVSTSLLWSGVSRRKDNVVALPTLHTDCDNEIDLGVVEELGGCAVNSGSPGHRHVYVPLSEPVTAAQYRLLEDGLVSMLGADSKKAGNDVLRPPGTHNSKNTARGGERTAVEWGVRPTGERINPRDLAGKMGVDLDQVKAKPKTKGNRDTTNGQCNGQRPRGERAKTKPFDLNQYPAVMAALDKDSGDRSADTQRVMAVCYRAGLRFKQACWAVYQSDRLTERLEERAEDHNTDLERRWRRAVDDSQREQQNTQSAKNYCPADDVAIGERIVTQHLDGKYIRTGGLGWLYYDGRKWGHVDEYVVYEQVRKAVKEIYRIEAEKARADGDVDRLKTLAGLLSAARIGALLRIAKGMLTAEDERLDNHPDLLNVGNGVLNLATGELTPHDAELKFTKVCETRSRYS